MVVNMSEHITLLQRDQPPAPGDLLQDAVKLSVAARPPSTPAVSSRADGLVGVRRQDAKKDWEIHRVPVALYLRQHEVVAAPGQVEGRRSGMGVGKVPHTSGVFP
jgi:hypothetical protein